MVEFKKETALPQNEIPFLHLNKQLAMSLAYCHNGKLAERRPFFSSGCFCVLL